MLPNSKADAWAWQSVFSIRCPAFRMKACAEKSPAKAGPGGVGKGYLLSKWANPKTTLIAAYLAANVDVEAGTC